MKKYITVALATTLILTACENNEGSDAGTTEAKANPITLEDVPSSPEFPDAALSIGKVDATEQGTDSVKLSFNFDVKNYELKAQTLDAKDKLCANSKDGQHIHFILDNQPYQALYEPKNETVVAKGSEHYLVAFLSRSYHQSLKNKDAALIYHFKINDEGKVEKMPEPTAPMITYSRPKGDYLGKDTENLLLDFYVWNANIGTDHQVKAAIQNATQDTTILLKEWKSYFLKNLAMGENTITLTLTDKDGNPLQGEGTTVSRTINLAQDEPMK